MRYLGLAGNHLTGSIPPKLGDLGNLEELYLHGNQLTGSIPDELGKLESLERLVLEGNSLAGWIPPELGNLESLRFLNLGFNNQLTGPLPTSLADLKSLRVLRVHATGLEGPIRHDFTKVPLDTFHWYGTGLCAPTSDEFQEWIKSIRYYRGGDNCPSP